MTSKQESQPTPSLAKMESETERDLREEVLKEQNDSLIATAPIPEPYEELTPLPAPVPLTQSQPDRMAPTPVAVAPPTPAPTAVQSAIASPSPSERTQGQGLEASPLATTMATAPSSGSGEQIASGLNPGLGNGYGPIRDDHVLRPLSGNQPPVYPSEDRLKRNAGEIVFRYFVNTDGTVKDIQIERGTGHKSLDLAALKAMKSWRYFPGQQGWARKGFHFNLSGEVETFHTRGRGLQMTASQPTEAGL
jgi:TonB family protein